MAFKWLTIGEMVAWEERARLRAVDRRALLDVLRTFGLSALVLEKRPWEISQGMRQRFEIAKAVAFEPDLVLMDEAFSGIDAGIKHNVFEYLSRTAALGKAFLFVTHDIGDVMRLADTILIIDNGRIVGKVVPVESRAERLRMAPADLIELDSAKAIATQLF
jgi:ABC-type nitrate/sulfonate/bicarbonate transport system ATPase subunit